MADRKLTSDGWVYPCHDKGPVRTAWRSRDDGLEECVRFVPGYNCSDDSGLGHGVHGMEIEWMLRGPAGAAVLKLSTDWIPGPRRPGHGLMPDGSYLWAHGDGSPRWPGGAGLYYHYASQPGAEGADEDCPIVPGWCRGDTHYGGADDAVRRFPAEGEAVIWAELEAAYARIVCAGYEDGEPGA
jgi:hypothetical protein